MHHAHSTQSTGTWLSIGRATAYPSEDGCGGGQHWSDPQQDQRQLPLGDEAHHERSEEGAEPLEEVGRVAAYARGNGFHAPGEGGEGREGGKEGRGEGGKEGRGEGGDREWQVERGRKEGRKEGRREKGRREGGRREKGRREGGRREGGKKQS